ncbi:mitochondrial ribonuclease P protein 1 homolog [Dermatophagoides pteronyssinus]|uniref:mitochondrial ribonuclease P protein 1 homolog n=1 Tax=Dermatophagoides pteronyssinus TaxID=6956 RepID=UPI003F674C75
MFQRTMFWRHGTVVVRRFFATKKHKYDPKFLQKLSEKIDNEKPFVNVCLEDFVQLFQQNDHNEINRMKIEKIINIYDEMKYDLQPVPSTLTVDDVENLLPLTALSDIRRQIRKLHRKELQRLLKKELKQQSITEIEQKQSIEDVKILDRSGLFDSNGNLIYGLWHNSLFTRINPKFRRLSLEKFRHAHWFGQNLFIDFSYSSYLSRHLCVQVANDLSHLIHFNLKQMNDPFKIILCGIDYDHYLWKSLQQSFPDISESVEHTEQKLMSLVSDPQQIVCFTSFETKTALEYNPNWSYVLPAIPERLMNQDFLTPSLKKMKIRRMGVPIDRFVIWQYGSKRLSLKQKIRILQDIRSKNFDWKRSIVEHVQTKRMDKS